MSTKATSQTTAGKTARGRGRPPISRDQSQIKELARLRKQKQRERGSDAGMVRIEIELPSDVLGSLAYTAALAGTNVRPLAAWLVKGALGPYRRELEALEIRAGALWLKATPYMRYANFLRKPGDSFRVHERTLRFEEWQPIFEELATIRANLMHRGWSPTRTEKFFRTSANRQQAATAAAKPSKR